MNDSTGHQPAAVAEAARARSACGRNEVRQSAVAAVRTKVEYIVEPHEAVEKTCLVRDLPRRWTRRLDHESANHLKLNLIGSEALASSVGRGGVRG